MTQVFDEEGNVIPVTLIEAGPVMVTQVKTKERDGYDAIQFGFGTKKHISKSLVGHFAKTQAGRVRWTREVRTGDGGDAPYALGQGIDVSVFEHGDTVSVAGLSKGKGFQGVVKRHGFHGASATHGTKHAHRQSGSIGATTPQRVLKGRRMAGRMGHERITVKNLKVVNVDKEKGLLALKGAVPGPRGTLLEIRG